MLVASPSHRSPADDENAWPAPHRRPAGFDAAPGTSVPALVLRTYLAGLGTAATLVVGATVAASLGLRLVLG